MFNKITEVVQNKELLVCVLIDEVESLAHARNQCVSGRYKQFGWVVNIFKLGIHKFNKKMF